VVTEPTPSGLHDLERIASLCRHFHVPVVVVINKYNLNTEQTRLIERFCDERAMEVLAHIRHDEAVVEALVRRMAVTEFRDDGIAEEVREAWWAIEQFARSRQAA
jgi:MinD superfamily P-loop ATPase